jgi:phosphatidate cytidylyltransferase
MIADASSTTESPGWPKGPTAFERRYGNAKMRVLTGALGIPVVLGAVWFGGWAFFLFMCLVIVGAMLEFYWICEAKGARPHKLIGVVFGVLLAFAFFHGVSDLLPGFGAIGPDDDVAARTMMNAIGSLLMRFLLPVGIIAIAVIATLIAEMRRDDASPIVNNATTALGLVYVGLFLATLVGIRQLFTTDPTGGLLLGLDATELAGNPAGAYMVIATLVTIWICDSAAYYVGRAMGRNRMAPRISPKKTWEGGIGGAVFAVASMVGFKYWLLDFLSLGDAIALGLVVGVLGQVGDLAESHVKRDAGVKDSSQLIPGHGGVFDRFDSLMFVAPVVYLYLNTVAVSRLL